MIFWFVGGACLIVLLVFGDPRIDLRLIAVGALLPDLPLTLTPLHSLTAAVAVLAGVMLVVRDRAQRRRWLAIPIGMLLHLVLDGMWGRPDVFWWPFAAGFQGGRLPSFERPVAAVLLMEAAGLVALWWAAARLHAMREGPPPESRPSC